MSERYLWDGSGPPDPEIERLERMLAPLRYQPLPNQYDGGRHGSHQTRPRLWWAAAAAVVLAAAGVPVIALVIGWYSWQTHVQSRPFADKTEQWHRLVDDVGAAFPSVPPDSRVVVIGGDLTDVIYQFHVMPSIAHVTWNSNVRMYAVPPDSPGATEAQPEGAALDKRRAELRLDVSERLRHVLARLVAGPHVAELCDVREGRLELPGRDPQLELPARARATRDVRAPDEAAVARRGGRDAVRDVLEPVARR